MLEQKLWDFIRKNIEKTGQNSHIFHSVASQVQLESHLSDGKKSFILKVPSPFYQNILHDYLPKIIEQMKTQKLLPKEEDYKHIKIISSGKSFVQKQPISLNSTEINYQNHQKTNFPKYPKRSSNSFIKTWNFSSFIQGSSNCFALAVAKSIAVNPAGNHSNPFFIYGGSGLGKTHLLHAIGLQVEKKHPHLTVRYLSAERFFNECILHIRKNEMDKFRQKYRHNIDILLLDDVQILGRGESTQEEFFHTFEALVQGRCQIVLASDAAPKNIKGLKTRIKTRFGGGVVADIQYPDPETKLAILKNKTFALKLSLGEELLSYILKIPTDSIRELEGYLNKIKIFCELQKTSPSLELLENLFPFISHEKNSSLPNQKNFIETPPKTKRVLTTIQKEVCSFFNLKNESELCARNRNIKLISARNIAMHIARQDFHISLAEIGKFFGGRDHSTVLKALQKNQILLSADKPFKSTFQQIQQNILTRVKKCE